jgi:hypothetical protein
MEQQPRDMKMVWTMIERAPSGGGPAKTFWTKVGVGFVNRDGSITLKLDAIPISGTMQVREWEPYDRRPDADLGPAPRPRAKALPATGESTL